MFSNYFKIFLRNLRRNPTYMMINVLGLAVGMAASILIFLFVKHELSYDRYHEKAERIYRVSRQWVNPDGQISLHLGHAAPPFAPLIKSDFGDRVEEAVRLLSNNPILIHEGKSFQEEDFFFADPEVFKVFSWKMLEGDPNQALTYPDGLVITESMARKYFGNEDAMGKAIEMKVGEFSWDLQVRGVMEDIPANSHFNVEFLATMNPVIAFYGSLDQMMQNFGNNSFSTYLLLAEGVDPHALESEFPAFIDRHIPNESNKPVSETTQLNLWPLTDIHLHSNLDSEIEPNSSIENVYIYSAIALFILLIACINFMNLATARSAKRAMEVGLRKVMGADKTLLVKQFMSESMFLVILALLFALVIVWVALPAFGNFTAKELSLNLLQEPQLLLWMALLVLLVGALAGSYPSLFLSGFQPVKVLKGTFKIGSAHEKFRSVLVVGQFAISIVMIVGVMVVLNQLNFIKNKDLGFDKEQIVVLPAYAEFTGNYEMMRERLLQHPGIAEVSLASRVPSGRLLDSQGTQAEVNGELLPINVRISDIHVSHSFLNTFGMNLVAGRDLDFNLASDSTGAFLLNEAAVRAIGWSSQEEAVEKQFHYGIRRGFVVGVIEDFHFESLHQPISPMVFMVPEDRFNQVAVKLHPDRQDEAMAFLQDEWIAMKSDFPFSPFFIEDRFWEQYETEEKVGQLFGFFAGLAIVISVLGLFGLAAYSTEQRTKEIGIRKVMGASVTNIVTLLGRDFLKLVLIGFLLAIPIGWYGMSQWLENFAYSVGVSWWIFVVAGLVAFLVAAITVSSQSIRAALVNPVDTFKEG
ncbi:ABC transporter permease [Litoribacter alkaliphilus]|uniref:ABC transporter permease n=1 Tax=Litoribacter ruber TaxID=702568 RepID=A0AAP2CFV6_9BACT|nr:ABC transporter permease [Litoribacter alkaliphilus]MBS9522804.1 ABC transporter permease [Litoribacter alkaliphilus]